METCQSLLCSAEGSVLTDGILALGGDTLPCGGCLSTRSKTTPLFAEPWLFEMLNPSWGCPFRPPLFSRGADESGPRVCRGDYS